MTKPESSGLISRSRLERERGREGDKRSVLRVKDQRNMREFEGSNRAVK